MHQKRHPYVPYEQFQTFTFYLGNQLHFFEKDMLTAAGYCNFLLGLPAAFLMGKIFEKAKPKLCVTFTDSFGPSVARLELLAS